MMVVVAILAIVLAVGLVYVARLLILEKGKHLQARQALEDAEGKVKAAQKKLSDTRKELEDEKSQHTELKSKHKQVKQDLHSQVQDKKKDRRDTEPAEGPSDKEVLLESRRDLAAALEENERLKARNADQVDRIKSLEASLAQAESRVQAARAAAAQSAVAPLAQAAEPTRPTEVDFEKKLKVRSIELENAQRQAARDVDQLKQRLNKALRETDKQRQRADNNEKAYNITKNQLDRTLDRLHEFDPSVPRPFRVPSDADISPAATASPEQEPAEELEPAPEQEASSQVLEEEARAAVVEPAETEPEQISATAGSEEPSPAPAEQPAVEPAAEMAAEEPVPPGKATLGEVELPTWVSPPAQPVETATVSDPSPEGAAATEPPPAAETNEGEQDGEEAKSKKSASAKKKTTRAPRKTGATEKKKSTP